MNFENIKSILLTLLVILSLVLTWSLWTYQPQLAEIKRPDYIRDVNIGFEKEPISLILPQQILFHKDHHTYGTMEGSEIRRIQSKLRQWSFDEFVDISARERDQYLDFVHGQEGIEVIFPTEIPIETFREIIKIEDKEIRNISFDRIIIPLNEGKDELPIAYFVSYEDQYIYQASLNNFSQTGFKTEIYNRAISYPKYISFKIDPFNTLFIQENSVQVNQLTYYSKSLSTEDFKDALFTNPSNVKRDIETVNEETYSDGSRALLIKDGLLRYINPTSESDEGIKSSGDYIQKSIDFVNDHSGWTDKYQFTNWDPNKRSTLFRLHINGVPVFHHSKLTSVYLEWDGTGLFDIYQRPLFKLHLPIDSETTKITLPPGQRVIDIIKSSPYVNIQKVKNITVAYQMTKDDTKVTVEPIWCIFENGDWKKVVFDDTDTKGIGGTIIGLEKN
ncbi:YycH family regulatory protein [Bacillus suaedaesalsae]|uniref:Regulatory protein YycH domain-containing protein n=1 Tax=Bacillus suaedaesalsae TaxID=2810349 RepID=A0ABS2DEM7_9BACI|nr:two-component system activity regulator YycH [Bacillus suaedaesalsae]MBM6616908.1 hypothetical protein [Bacillus suaedaesalsae]